MLAYIADNIPEIKANPDRYKNYFRETSVPARTILLREGEIAKKVYFIKKGCLRLGFYHKGKDISFQFFFENHAVSSIESFRSRKPSNFFIETIEFSEISYLTRDNFEKLTSEFPLILQYLNSFISQRMANYSSLFLSFIRDTPSERYLALMKEHPEIIQRVPQHYIASYLGITPVSLSRIRKRCFTEH